MIFDLSARVRPSNVLMDESCTGAVFKVGDSGLKSTALRSRTLRTFAAARSIPRKLVVLSAPNLKRITLALKRNLHGALVVAPLNICAEFDALLRLRSIYALAFWRRRIDCRLLAGRRDDGLLRLGSADERS